MIISNLNIGSPEQDVQANFLDENGYGKLRFYSGKFQYYNTTQSTWIDIEMSDHNTYVINMIPKSMKKFDVQINYNIKHYELYFEEPDDTIIDGDAACIVSRIIIRRKLNSYPTSIDDGEIVAEIPRSSFGTHINTPYSVTDFIPNINETWYFKAFVISTLNCVNDSSLNEAYLKYEDYENVYGIEVDYENNTIKRIGQAAEALKYSDPSEYFNTIPCFQRKKVNLSEDGTINTYYGDENYKSDGTNGDVMILQPKFYYKVNPIKLNDKELLSAQYLISPIQKEGFKCHPAFIVNNQEIDHYFIAAYESYYNSESQKLQSKSGVSFTGNITIGNITAYTKNKGNNWSLESYQNMCVTQLLILIEYATNLKDAIGTGISNGAAACGYLDSFGEGTGSKNNAVIYRGLENPWGNSYCWLNNIKSNLGIAYISGYNTDYSSTGITMPSTNTYIKYFGYISDFDWCFIPITGGGSSTDIIRSVIFPNTNATLENSHPYWGNAYSGGSISAPFDLGFEVNSDISGAITTTHLQYTPLPKS